MWHTYKNGNYVVKINDTDGTKIRICEEDEFKAEFPESIDLNITNKCDANCQYCFVDAKPDGKEAVLMDPTFRKNRRELDPYALHDSYEVCCYKPYEDQVCGYAPHWDFLETLRPYTEVAIGGGNPLSHPQLDIFLNYLKSRNLFANITVNKKHFLKEFDRLKLLSDEGLIHGLGVSISEMFVNTNETLEKLQQLPNVVVHVINKVITHTCLAALGDSNLKLLILGYKNKGRGLTYKDCIERTILRDDNQKEDLDELLKRFKSVSFDNLALKQLHIKERVSEEAWQQLYNGDDGSHTMYIDLVNSVVLKSSTSDKKYGLHYSDTIDTLFNYVRC